MVEAIMFNIQHKLYDSLTLGRVDVPGFVLSPINEASTNQFTFKPKNKHFNPIVVKAYFHGNNDKNNPADEEVEIAGIHSVLRWQLLVPFFSSTASDPPEDPIP